jgi:hypothetical protein
MSEELNPTPRSDERKPQKGGLWIAAVMLLVLTLLVVLNMK